MEHLQTINGIYLKGKELEEFKERAIKSSKFEELLEAINDLLGDDDLTKEQLLIEYGYKGDIELEKDYVVSASQIVLGNESKTARIVYRELKDLDVPESFKLQGQVLTPDKVDSRHLLGISFTSEGELEIDSIHTDYPDTELPDITEPLPDDPNYVPQDTENYAEPKEKKGVAITKAWWTSNGCLPGGYQHCGGNCGYGLKHGGKKPINYTDSCCVLHDRCYGSKTKNCKCDSMLIKCVRNEITWATFAIRLYFGPKGC